jgi:serine/threonine protein kinase
MIGKTLGHYEITSQLGEGGMGAVWKARDSKLGQEVAVKTLPEEFARDQDRWRVSSAKRRCWLR